MHFNEIKFQFDISSTDSEIDKAFKKIGSLLNIRFDDNLNEYSTEDNSPYTLLNISDFNKESIENEIRTFFTFSFKEIINVPFETIQNSEINRQSIIKQRILWYIEEYRIEQPRLI